ncbi:MAG: glycosyltransferase [Methanolobus sp.]|uniref:glycosyltransferase n=1 Tax=Methanolobus sp. TaxID=1874737 RepID=UPI00272FC822|nr:glycosyltransferase [Methanolobus sp.]MDP2216510.1 glycosyltransferase [Methanolobus sp.]
MKVCIFSGVISLGKNNSDVRKNYLIERIRYFGSKSTNFTILSPLVPKIEYMSYDNFEYIHYHCIQKKGMKLLSSMVFSIPKLIHIECDVLHCLNYQSFLVANIVNSFRKQKYLLIFEAMGLAFAESTIDAKSSLKVKTLKSTINRLEKAAFKKSDGVIVYTEILKHYVTEHFNIEKEKIFVVPHGVDLNDEEHLSVESDFLPINCPKNNQIALYVGSLSELHGTPYLMQIALELSIRKPDVCLLILGTGPLKDQFERYVEEKQLKNVILTGYLSSDKVPLYLEKAGVLLIPHSQCLQTELDPPTKLFEYLKAGKPIVSFDFKAIAEIVGDNAVLIEPDNPSKFAEGIIDVLDNKEHYLKVAERARSIVEQYSWQASAEKQYYVYKEVYKKFLK